MTELMDRARTGDSDAMGKLIEENNGLIWSVARRYFGRGAEPDDLYQLGCIGFIKAVQGFDAAFGTRFSTYAVPKIAGEIRRFLRDDGAVKVSRSIKEKALIIRQAESALEQRLGREATLSELSEETGISAEDIALCESAVAAPDSLQRENTETGQTLGDTIGDFGSEDKLLERVALREAISSLDDREQRVILLRYFHDFTQARTAAVLGVSQVQVSRIEKRAVERLRERLS